MPKSVFHLRVDKGPGLWSVIQDYEAPSIRRLLDPNMGQLSSRGGLVVERLHIHTLEHINKHIVTLNPCLLLPAFNLA